MFTFVIKERTNSMPIFILTIIDYCILHYQMELRYTYYASVSQVYVKIKELLSCRLMSILL